MESVNAVIEVKQKTVAEMKQHVIDKIKHSRKDQREGISGASLYDVIKQTLDDIDSTGGKDDKTQELKRM